MNKDKFYYNDGSTSSVHDYISSRGIRLLHRVDGPAVEYANGNREWFINGKLHRIDGPAIDPTIFRNGSFRHYLDGESYSKEDYDKIIKEITDLPLALRLVDPREWVRSMVDQRCEGCYGCIEPCGRTKANGDPK